MAIARAGIWIAFNRSGKGDRHRSGIALAAIGLVVDGDKLLRIVDNGVGDTDVGAVVFARAEIGMKADGEADVVDVVGGIRVYRPRGDVFVPEIVGREWEEAVKAGPRPIDICEQLDVCLEPLTWKFCVEEALAPGLGFCTVIEKVPAVVAVFEAVSCVEETKVVESGVEFI